MPGKHFRAPAQGQRDLWDMKLKWQTKEERNQALAAAQAEREARAEQRRKEREREAEQLRREQAKAARERAARGAGMRVCSRCGTARGSLRAELGERGFEVTVRECCSHPWFVVCCLSGAQTTTSNDRRKSCSVWGCICGFPNAHVRTLVKLHLLRSRSPPGSRM
jgi:hypothetical protein